MLPPGGSIFGRLTQDLPLGCLQGGRLCHLVRSVVTHAVLCTHQADVRFEGMTLSGFDTSKGFVTHFGLLSHTPTFGHRFRCFVTHVGLCTNQGDVRFVGLYPRLIDFCITQLLALEYSTKKKRLVVMTLAMDVDISIPKGCVAHLELQFFGGGLTRICCFFFFLTLARGPRRSLNVKLSDARVYEPGIRARHGTTAHC